MQGGNVSERFVLWLHFRQKFCFFWAVKRENPPPHLSNHPYFIFVRVYVQSFATKLTIKYNVLDVNPTERRMRLPEKRPFVVVVVRRERRTVWETVNTAVWHLLTTFIIWFAMQCVAGLLPNCYHIPPFIWYFLSLFLSPWCLFFNGNTGSRWL